MSDKIDISIVHKNAYRQKSLDKNQKRVFREDKVLKDTDYVVLDFLEERFDLACIGDSYITLSDAFEEADTNTPFECIIDRHSELCMELFRDACRRFMSMLSRYAGLKVVLVENYLCERKGTFGKTAAYEDLFEIQEINKVLKECYEFFEKEYPEVPIVRMERSDLNYTDEYFRYGCRPWHMNALAYIGLGQQLKEVMESF
jgi:hypothetical protein